jgi:metal-dependent amidase/aminoacylase/carboxypeptidase family protein
VAEGAALMTGCEVKISQDREMYDMRPSYVIGEVYQKNMQEAGLDTLQGRTTRGFASTDFGNVSYKVPSVTGSFAISQDPIPGHSQQVVDASGSEFGYDQFIKVSTAMALTALDLMTDPELIKRAWEAHENWDALYVK